MRDVARRALSDRLAGVLPREEGKGGAKGESDAEGKPAAARRPRKKKGADAAGGAGAGAGAGSAGPDSPKAEKTKRRKVDGKEAKKEAADA